MILGITPARGGSKGIPRKNIKEIAGKPLIAWTIESARKCNLIDRYVVSTEDEEIASVAKEYGADVLYRPSEISSDEASTLSVLQHAVSSIPCDIIVLLQATSPIRHEGLIDECIKEFEDNGYDSLATGFICKYKEYGNNSLRRQDIQGFFYDDGNVYVIKADLIRSGDRYGKKIGKKIISRWENVEIDDEFDFWLAEHILQNDFKLFRQL
ncbi:MAG: CMP-N-acetylneuraminic acid synthetase [Planctomycetes bacterium RIFCSPLOWO2_12_FULL_39_13]|nr:MAG: CMP-N-acetylneuraminic acid synthetase [Planctomycetes bacterium RIFCSPLOWO2_12_FULL_39_13]